MRKIVSIFAVGLLFLTACDGGKLKQVESENVQLDDSLRVALSNQDSLLVLLNDITDGMNQIKDLEKILGSTNDLTAESQSRKDQIRNDMYSIQQALQERRERLAELEKKLKSSQGYNATLQKTIDNLKAEIATQETTISTLRNDLAAAKIQIADLGTKVDSLSTTVASVTEEKVKAQEETQNVTNELNTCYYAIGTKKELKEAKIIETGFLRKTKLLQADFQQSYFTKADKRTMTVIPTQSKKAKILTNMPSDSYVIEDEGDTKVIKVTNPERFWSLSNYLVIQVD
ncbi:MAG TPA: hypothetical protein PK430_01655 [Muribaculum sp.]|jgi:chromosome segregation ATPase|uniref:Chromosome partition protein Smc n=1 Tax=Heminiphilus faecis TaxID=2601703 RepID=A0ABV4CSM7_9BACT|nr:hypothetical protein [Heminiphilus faecis]RLT77587.1 hypothetical protein D7V95_02450 [bacterium J10(2018)]HRF67907.1 hypothetical protein [Muribaculum sp.]